MMRIPPLLDVTLSIYASLFFFSLCLCCVCTCSLFVSFFYFLIFFLRVPQQFIEELRNNFSLFLLKTFIFFHKYYLNIFFFWLFKCFDIKSLSGSVNGSINTKKTMRVWNNYTISLVTQWGHGTLINKLN